MQATDLQRTTAGTKAVRSAKCQHWSALHADLLKMQKEDSKEFWRTVGNLGVARDRKPSIPMEVVLPDGAVSRDQETVLARWQSFLGC